jgi:hypothetical protein
MEPTYTLPVLLDLCGGTEEDLRDVLPWHDLKDGGLWLSSSTYGLTGVDLETLGWHPLNEKTMPALSVPFTARGLAAFMLAGGGLSLFDRFDEAPIEFVDIPAADTQRSEGDHFLIPEQKVLNYLDRRDLLEVGLHQLGENSGKSREVMTEALRLRRQADVKFGRDDEGVRKSANWLLNDAHRESVAAVAAHEPTGETAKQRRARLLAWHDEEKKSPAGARGAVERVFVREQVGRPTADRGNIGTDIRKARKERDAAERAGPFDGLHS